jgi:hypothetical protein
LLLNLIKFDFKNGPLRQKYDGVKYAVKKLENILYELVVTGAENDETGMLCAVSFYKMEGI